MSDQVKSPFHQIPKLTNDLLQLILIQESDFEALFKIASDPLLWEQHPNKNRYQKDVFKTFFEGAVESNCAFMVYEKSTGELVGSSRFYDYDETKKEVAIGYTFISRKFWGKGINPELKKLMIEYAFKHVDKIIFHIGAGNKRSQIAIERLGAKKVDEQLIEYYGEDEKLNFIYQLEKS